MNPNSPEVTPPETPTSVAEQNSQKNHKNILKIVIPVATILLIVVATF